MEEKIYTHCIRCGRKLKTDISKELGYGKICYEKIHTKLKQKPLFETQRKEDNFKCKE